MAGTLYIVGTPIGNLEDLSDRARRILGTVHLVVAEDTRRTGRLLAALGVRSRVVSFFEGNEAGRIPGLLAALREGSDVAVVSDAGMPGVSDPGYRLVAACVEGDVPVDVIPGPSAAVAALVLSGLPTDRFSFEGFLPRSGRGRADRLEEIARDRRTTVLFESPRRMAVTLADLLRTCGDRRVAIVRELTKLHQEVVRGTLSEVAPDIGSRKLKGEIIVVLGGRGDAPAPELGLDRALAVAHGILAGGARKREAARRAAELTGVPAREVYGALVADRRGAQGTAAGSNRAVVRRAESSE